MSSHGIARVICKRGFCSRKAAEILVKTGRVKLCGKIVLNPETSANETDEITIDEKVISSETKIYFAINKPRKIITTANDEKGRKNIMQLFSERYSELYPTKKMPHMAPVGRLDSASEGLLLITNDSEWANLITQPGNTHYNKTYKVHVNGILTKDNLKQMEEGLMVQPRIYGEKPEFMRVKKVTICNVGDKNCWLEIILAEGKNREIRRMLKTLGFEVLRLIRIKIGNYTLDNLKPGEIKQIEKF